MEKLEVRIAKQLLESMNSAGIEFNLSEMSDDLQGPDAQKLNTEQASEYIALEYLEGDDEAGNIAILGAVGRYIEHTDAHWPEYFRPIPDGPAPEIKDI